MSQENVEIVRRVMDAVNRGDPAGLDYYDPDVEVQDYPGLPDAEWHQGREGVIAWLVRLYEAFGEFRLDTTDTLEAGDRVLIDWHASGAGRRSECRFLSGERRSSRSAMPRSCGWRSS